MFLEAVCQNWKIERLLNKAFLHGRETLLEFSTILFNLTKAIKISQIRTEFRPKLQKVFAE